MIAIILLSGCKKDEPAVTPPTPATNKFEVFKQYLMDNNMDTDAILDSWITTADKVHEDLDNFYVIDLREETDFTNGHIPGAVRSDLGAVLDAAALSNGKPIIVACYTGQTAGHAVMALRLSGYPTAKVLMWGMSSWNVATAGSWQSNIGNTAVGHENWKLPAATAGLVEFGEPTLETTAETGEEILAERVAALLSGGMNKITKDVVLASPSSYFINNYWDEESSNLYGHIVDAYRINPLSLAGGEYKYLNQAATVVTYCWTGQTSSMMSAYLKVLGYDTKSLLFGANGMIYENLHSHQYSDAAIMGYELETSIAPYEGFGQLKTYLIDNNMDITDVVADGWITTATDVYTKMEDDDETNDYYVIDIRSADDFATGHIEGAVNSTLGNVLETAAAANGQPIIVTCFTGQTAGHAVVALRLSGYADAKVMKWGMASWNDATSGSWISNVGDAAVGSANWTFPALITPNIEYGDPSFETTAADAAGILAERVNVLLSGMNAVSNAVVLETPGDYFINNFWDQESVDHYGHIAGAFRVNPLSLEGGEYVYLNNTAPVVTYCWTGQTSSMITAYLKVLGYDSKSLLFGANGLIHSNLESHQYGEGAIMGYPLATE